jgi:putative transposase
MIEGTIFSKEYPEFLTVTCLEWKPLLKDDKYKDIITSSIAFLYKQQRAFIYAFVIMDNHFHLIWQMIGDHKREDVQRDFLKYTGQQVLKYLRNENSTLLNELIVNAKDRKHQVWERNSLGVSLWSESVFNEKLEYIHYNPVKAGICKYPEDYKYSSARFYEMNTSDWEFLSHYQG